MSRGYCLMATFCCDDDDVDDGVIEEDFDLDNAVVWHSQTARWTLLNAPRPIVSSKERQVRSSFPRVMVVPSNLK